MSTPQEKALYANRKGTATHYADGKLKVKGKTKAQAKADAKEAFKNRHNDPSYKGLSPGYHVGSNAHTTPIKKALDWAGDVGRAHQRNQKHPNEKGYREDYR